MELFLIGVSVLSNYNAGFFSCRCDMMERLNEQKNIIAKVWNSEETKLNVNTSRSFPVA